MQKKKWENKRVDALRGWWTITGIAKKSAKLRGCIRGRVDND